MSIFDHYKIEVYPGSACLKAIAGTWNANVQLYMYCLDKLIGEIFL